MDKDIEIRDSLHLIRLLPREGGNILLTINFIL